MQSIQYNPFFQRFNDPPHSSGRLASFLQDFPRVLLCFLRHIGVVDGGLYHKWPSESRLDHRRTSKTNLMSSNDIRRLLPVEFVNGDAVLFEDLDGVFFGFRGGSRVGEIGLIEESLSWTRVDKKRRLTL